MKKTTAFIVTSLLAMTLVSPVIAAQNSSNTTNSAPQNNFSNDFENDFQGNFQNNFQNRPDGDKHPPKGDNIGEPPGGYGRIAPPDGEFKEGAKGEFKNRPKDNTADRAKAPSASSPRWPTIKDTSVWKCLLLCKL